MEMKFFLSVNRFRSLWPKILIELTICDFYILFLVSHWIEQINKAFSWWIVLLWTPCFVVVFLLDSLTPAESSGGENGRLCPGPEGWDWGSGVHLLWRDHNTRGFASQVCNQRFCNGKARIIAEFSGCAYFHHWNCCCVGKFLLFLY